jgi:hypothetical protein
MNNWITGDFKNSKIHRQIRLISMSIFLDNTPSITSQRNFANFDMVKYYTISIKDLAKINQIEYEQFDFNIIKPNINPLADSVVNEIWPLLRMLWKSRGSYSIVIHIDKEKSYNEFGVRLGCDFTGNYNFSIDDTGNWSADFKFNFKQDVDAWKYQDYSRETSMSATRARTLAIPGSDGEVQWNYSIYDVHIAKLEELKLIDFSFNYNYKDNGKW